MTSRGLPMNAMQDTTVLELEPTLQRLRQAWQARRPDYHQRRDDLLRLRKAVVEHQQEMLDALNADFGNRSRHETLLGDMVPVLAEIDHMRAHLRRWMRPQRRSPGWRLWPAKVQVRYVPLGVVGVISPWNYPIQLALAPLAAAIAAGNHVYLKPSEHSPHTSKFLHALLAHVFPPERVAVAMGDAELGAAFAGLPFDHLLFTGSTAIGRKVMAAAAANLTPVTLELGGKSPAVVGMDAPMAQVATRLATGKFYNAGQTCIAPDYVLVPSARRDELVHALRTEVASRYPMLDGNVDYTRVINEAQYRRLRGYLDDARARGLEVIELAPLADRARAEAERLLPPTLVLEPGDDATVMQEEIFGPILPIKSYKAVDEAIEFVNRRDRPLGLYWFGTDGSEEQKVLDRTISGGVTVNDVIFHVSAEDLPFGGIGPAGMGNYHGHDGFKTFSHAKSIYRQPKMDLAGLAGFKPPYGEKTRKALARELKA